MTTLFCRGLFPDRNVGFFGELCQRHRVIVARDEECWAELGFPVVYAEDLVPEAERSLSSQVLEREVDRCVSFTETKLREMCRRPGVRGLTDAEIDQIRTKAVRAILVSRVVGTLCDRKAIDMVVTNADYSGWRRPAVVAARDRGIPTLTIEHGFFCARPEPQACRPGTASPFLYVSDYVNLDNPLDLDIVRQLREAAGTQSTSELLALGTPKDGTADTTLSREDACNRLGLRSDRPVVMIAGQWTFAVAPSFLRSFAEEAGFYRDALAAVGRLPREMDCQVIVKVHPALGEERVLTGIAEYVAGERDRCGVQKMVTTVGYLPESLAAADAVVCPGPSSVLWEAVPGGTAGFILPLPSQIENVLIPERLESANELCRRGLMRYALSSEDLTDRLAVALRPGARESAVEAARQLATDYDIVRRTPDEKAERVADWIDERLGATRTGDSAHRREGNLMTDLELYVARNPHDAAARKKLARQCIADDQAERALTILMAAVQQDHSDADALCCVGLACEKLGRADDARNYFKKAVALDGGNAEAAGGLRRLAGGSDAEVKPTGDEAAQPVPYQERYYGFDRPEVQALVPETARTVLDVGCAAGNLGAALKRRGAAEVWGIEYVPEVAESARGKLDRVLTGRVEDVLSDIPDGHFDAIVFADVLEHLADPVAVLRAMRRKLSPTGELVVSVPNVRHWSVLKDLLEGRWDYQDAGILDRTHLRFFTRKTLMDVLVDAGFQSDEVRATELQGGAVPNAVVRALAGSGVDTSTLENEGRHYQYLARAHSIGRGGMVSIVVLTRNALEYTRQCLESVRRCTETPYEIIVVDNGSTDGTVEFLRAQAASHTDLRVIENAENLGFAGGNNQGIEAARGEYVLLLNNDVVVTPGWLDRMVRVTDDDPKIGIVGPMTNRISGAQQVPSVAYDQDTLAGLDTFAQAVAQQHGYCVTPTWRIVGFCMLIRRAVIDAIGGLDTAFGRGNHEDDDYCIRAAIAGFRAGFAHDSFVHHFGSRTFVQERVNYAKVLNETWKTFKEKWGLPASLPYGTPYDVGPLLKQPFDVTRHYVPVCALVSAREPAEWIEVIGRDLAADDSAAALRDSATAVAVCADSHEAWLMRAQALRVSGHPAEALQAVEKSVQLNETPSAIFELVRISRDAGEAARADQILAYLSQRFPDWTAPDDVVAAA